MSNVGPNDISQNAQSSLPPVPTQQRERSSRDKSIPIARTSSISSAILQNPVATSSSHSKRKTNEKESRKETRFSTDRKGSSTAKTDSVADPRLKRQRSLSTDEKKAVKDGYMVSSKSTKRPLSQEFREKNIPSSHRQRTDTKKIESKCEKEEAEEELPSEKEKEFKTQKLFTLGVDREREVITNGHEFIPAFAKALAETREPLSMHLSTLITRMDSHNNSVHKIDGNTSELIQMHAQARLLLYFHLALIYCGAKCDIDWIPAKKQLYTGSEIAGTEACHHAIFAEINDTHIFHLKNELIEVIRNIRENRRKPPPKDNEQEVQKMGKEREITTALLDRLEEINLPRGMIQSMVESILSEKKHVAIEVQNLWDQAFPLNDSAKVAKEELKKSIMKNNFIIPAALSQDLKRAGIPAKALRDLLNAIKRKQITADKGVEQLFDKWAFPPFLNSNIQFYYLNHHTLIAPSELNRVDDAIEKQVRLEAMKKLREISHLKQSPVSGTIEVGKCIENTLHECLKIAKEKTALVASLETNLSLLDRLLNNIQNSNSSQLTFDKKIGNLMTFKKSIQDISVILDRLSIINQSRAAVNLIDPNKEMHFVNEMKKQLTPVLYQLNFTIDEKLEAEYKSYKESPFFHADDETKTLKLQIDQYDQKIREINNNLTNVALNNKEIEIKNRVEKLLEIDSVFMIADRKFETVDDFINFFKIDKEEYDTEIKGILNENEYRIFFEALFKVSNGIVLESEKANSKVLREAAVQKIRELRNPKEPESSYLRSQYPTIVTLILNPKIQNHTKEILRRYPISNDKLTLVQNIIFTQLSATANFTEQLKESRHHEHSHLSKFLIRSIVN